MITLPVNGWSKIKIHDSRYKWEDRLSYLDDVPFKLLNALIESCEEHKPVAVRFDAEGYEYITIFDWLSTYIIYQDSNIVRAFLNDSQDQAQAEDDNMFIALDAKREDLSRELIGNIRANTREWAAFWYDAVPDDLEEANAEEAIGVRITQLLKLCDKLESLLPADDYTLLYPRPQPQSKKSEPPIEYFYEAGYEEPEILGSGTSYSVMWSGTSEEEAKKTFTQKQMTFLRRIHKEHKAIKFEYWNQARETWE